MISKHEERAMRWWGWGDPAHVSGLPDHVADFLAGEVGIAAELRPAVAIEDVALTEPALSAEARAALAAAVGEEYVGDDALTRIVHAAGKSYPDLVRQRSGDCTGAPDAVVLPGSAGQVRDALAACVEHGVAVVPFGGGTSVVGGVEPIRGDCGAVIALDLARMDRLADIDVPSLTATFEPGARGPAAESLLAAEGLTLGHFPQSYEYASLGGYVATRSAGQASTGYGRIDELVLGLRLVAPAGDIVLPPVPASAAGPGLRDLIVGSEGTLGVITEVALEVRPAPAAKRYEGWFFRAFEDGVEALRALEQAHAAPDVSRLSDEEETRLLLALAGTDSLKSRVGAAYLRARGYANGCVAIFGWEGDEGDVARRAARSGAIARDGGGISLGRAPGEAWASGRFAGPYLRDDMLDLGVMAETLETATQWSRLLYLHAAVDVALRDALSQRGTPPLVMCHVSHLYGSGASLYFTFIARQQEGEEIEQWRAAKRAACDAIVTHGGTITHHHAVGRDHAEWMHAEVGDLGLATLRSIKDTLDPSGIMNPGKLLPEQR
jgi:alkyldihydroxyacetonephosphate synthase